MTDLLWTLPEADTPETPVLLLAHGAGAAMDSGFMNRFAGHAATNGLAVARFEFAYMARRRVDGRKRPPPRADKLIGEFQTALQAVLDQRKRIARLLSLHGGDAPGSSSCEEGCGSSGCGSSGGGAAIVFGGGGDDAVVVGEVTISLNCMSSGSE